jgi:hypothetical protein
MKKKCDSDYSKTNKEQKHCDNSELYKSYYWTTDFPILFKPLIKFWNKLRGELLWPMRKIKVFLCEEHYLQNHFGLQSITLDKLSEVKLKPNAKLYFNLEDLEWENFCNCSPDQLKDLEKLDDFDTFEQNHENMNKLDDTFDPMEQNHVNVCCNCSEQYQNCSCGAFCCECDKLCDIDCPCWQKGCCKNNCIGCMNRWVKLGVI